MENTQYKIKVLTSNLKSFSGLEKILNKISSDIKVTFLPTKRKRFVVLKSPHVNKKSKEHFQFLRYQRLYCISVSSTALIKLFLLNAPNDLTIIFKKVL